MTELLNIEMSDVAATSLLTLYCHALESQSSNPILDDPKAVEIANNLNPILSKSPKKLYRKMARGKLDKRLAVYVCMRARRYDRYVRDFLRHSPDGVIVNIGCGLDTRFFRVDNQRMHFYDLDLPEVIDVKRNFVKENDRYHFIASSVLNHEWMGRLLCHKGSSFLFLAEGVFMYLDGDAVKSLVLKLQSQFPGCELVCEVANSFWLKPPLRSMVNFKFQRQLHLGKDAAFNFGIRNAREMEQWNSGIELLDEWSYLDEPEPKIGWFRLLRYVELFRKTQWTVHYKLG
jgi:methyltransferase (TIGR00027 family)